MSLRMVSAILAVVSLSGCVFHMDSAIPDDSAQTDRMLAGIWYSQDSSRAVVTEAPSGYRLEYRSTQDTVAVSLHGRLGSLGGRTVLEVWPAHATIDDSWPVGRALLILEIAGDVIKTWWLDPDSVMAALERERVPTLSRENDVVIIASTATLAAKYADYLRRPGFLNDGELWHRHR